MGSIDPINGCPIVALANFLRAEYNRYSRLDPQQENPASATMRTHDLGREILNEFVDTLHSMDLDNN